MKALISISSLMALFSGSAFAQNPACKALADVTTKYLTIPTHIYSTETGPATGGKPRNSETIYLIDKSYVMVNGKWRASPVTPKMMLQNLKEARAEGGGDATHATCKVVRDEAVNGEAATLYSEHTESTDAKTDSLMWVSKSRGLPLKMENDTAIAGATSKDHREMRFEYTNVTAPAGVK